MNFFQKGRITKEFEVKQVGNSYVSSTTLAYNSPYKNKNTNEYKSNFIQIEVWGEAFAKKMAPLYKKGNRVLVKGFLEYQNYQDKEGKNRVTYKIVCERFGGCELLDFNNNGNSNSSNNYTPSFEPSNDYSNNQANNAGGMDLNPESFSAVGDDEDIPF